MRLSMDFQQDNKNHGNGINKGRMSVIVTPFEQKLSSDFTHVHLPIIGKPVFRMGVAGNYGLTSPDIEWAADHGANYWVWGGGFKRVTHGIKSVIQKDRERHIIAMLGWGMFGPQVRLSVESALKKLNTDYLDVFKLGWLGRTSAHSPWVMEALIRLKQEGKIRAIGTSIHDRKRAGILVQNSQIDLFMIRYNAKHTGAEFDIFPFLDKRNPAVVSYTALAWRQLIRPLKNAAMPPWPGAQHMNVPPLTPELCYRFVLSNPWVHIVLTGPRNREELKQNLDVVKKGPLSPEELAWVKDYGLLVRSKKPIDYV